MSDTTAEHGNLAAGTAPGGLAPWLLLALPVLALLGYAAVDEPMAAAGMLAVPLLPFVFYAIFRGLAGERNFAALLSVVILFILSANFRYREYADKSVDLQVAVKIVALAAAGGIGMIALRRIFKQLYLHGLIYWMAFHVVMIVSSTYSLGPLHAAVATMSLLASFLFLCHLCVRYGPDRLVEILVWTGLLMCVGSLISYFAVPSFGRMKDWYGTELVVTSRLQGLFGASNGAGASGATMAFLIWAFYLRQRGASRLVGWSALAVALLCCIMSNNRMALVSIFGSIAVWYLVSGNFGRKLLFLVALGILAGVTLFTFSDEIFSLVSRTGDAEEITSATGRTRIWSVVSELVWHSPIIGQGYASAQHILSIHPDLFVAAAHCHNWYLEMFFSTGLVGLLLLFWCILTTIVLAARVGAARELALFCFFLSYGLTEPVIGGLTNLAFMMMQASLVLLFHRAKQREQSNRRFRVAPVAIGGPLAQGPRGAA
ncbi:MAG: O-antigen ligase family protein [Hyphomicrobiaceae bacterium]